MTCQQLDAHKEISLFDNFKCIDTRCPYIYLRVQNATSLIKCAGKKNAFLHWARASLCTAMIKWRFNIFLFSYLYFTLLCVSEMECRSPNQVRYIIRMQNTYENSADKKILTNVFIMLFLHLQLAIFNV